MMETGGPVRLVLIAAMSRNRVLSSRGKIPWRLPRDIAHFRQCAAGHWLLLGRRTYEEMRGWFQPGQTPVVLTSDPSLSFPGGWTAGSLEEAVVLAGNHGVSDLLVCGGGSVYALTLPVADSLILTTVEADFEGDVFFPAFPAADDWRLDAETFFPPDETQRQAMRISRWSRVKI